MAFKEPAQRVERWCAIVGSGHADEKYARTSIFARDSHLRTSASVSNCHVPHDDLAKARRTPAESN